MRTWGADGTPELDEYSFTVRVTHSSLVPKTGGRYVDIPVAGVDPQNHSAVCVPVVPYSEGSQMISAISFTPVVYAGYIRVFFGSPARDTGPTGITTQRLLVMRYK